MIRYIKESYDLNSFPELRNSTENVNNFAAKKQFYIMENPKVKEIISFDFWWCELDRVFKLYCKVLTNG